MKATITREKVYATRGRVARVAWKWHYTVTIENHQYPYQQGSGLDNARSFAKRKGATEIVENF